MACITEAVGFPNASGTIPPENGMISEVLGELGWNTYLVGKWHLCPTIEMNLASTRRNWPTGRGFERFYGFLGAETNQWYPELVYDNHPVDQPKSPGHFELAGEGLCIGRDSGAAVTDDYSGPHPHRFTGGTIKRVAVDVSGEPYLDLERAAAAMLARE